MEQVDRIAIPALRFSSSARPTTAEDVTETRVRNPAPRRHGTEFRGAERFSAGRPRLFGQVQRKMEHGVADDLPAVFSAGEGAARPTATPFRLLRVYIDVASRVPRSTGSKRHRVPVNASCQRGFITALALPARVAHE